MSPGYHLPGGPALAFVQISKALNFPLASGITKIEMGFQWEKDYRKD
jgi:hypothetical protein